MPVLQKKSTAKSHDAKPPTTIKAIEVEMSTTTSVEPVLALELNGAIYDVHACEEHFQDHPLVQDCLLIKVGVLKKQLPALVFTTGEKVKDRVALSLDMLSWARKNQQTSGISLFYHQKAFPLHAQQDRPTLRKFMEMSVNPADYLECPVS